MSNALKPPPKTASSDLLDRPGWVPAHITHDWNPNPYAYQTEEELMPGGGLHGQLLAYIMELLRAPLKARGLMLLLDTFLLYRDARSVKQRIAPDLLLMPFGFPPPSAYDLDVQPPPLCVVEVTSPKSHLKDLVDKVPLYLDLGIPTYLAIDAITPLSRLRAQIELHVWQRIEDRPREMATDEEGCLALPEVGLKVQTEGQRIVFSDEGSGEVLSDSEQLSAVLQEKQQALQKKDQVLQQKQQALEETEQALLKAQQSYQTEAEARRVAEEEIARLKALLEKKG